MEKNLKQEELHIAVQNQDRGLVKKLLDEGFHPNQFDEISHTPLHYACELEDYYLIKLLLDYGADINAQNLETDAGNTPLGNIAKEASAELIEYLLQKGADPTKRGWMKLNAIDRAKQRTDKEKKEILELLNDAI